MCHPEGSDRITPRSPGFKGSGSRSQLAMPVVWASCGASPATIPMIGSRKIASLTRRSASRATQRNRGRNRGCAPSHPLPNAPNATCHVARYRAADRSRITGSGSRIRPRSVTKKRGRKGQHAASLGACSRRLRTVESTSLGIRRIRRCGLLVLLLARRID